MTVAAPERYLNADDKLTVATMPGQALAVFSGGPRGRVKRDVQCRADHPPAVVEMHRGGDTDIYEHVPGFTAVTYRYARTVSRSAADR